MLTRTSYFLGSHLSHSNKHRRCHSSSLGSASPDGGTEDICRHSCHVRCSLPLQPPLTEATVPSFTEPRQSQLIYLRFKHPGPRDGIVHWFTSTSKSILLSLASLILLYSFQHFHNARKVVPVDLYTIAADI